MWLYSSEPSIMTESLCDKCHKVRMIWNVCEDCDGQMICSRCEEWHTFSSKFSFTKTHAMTPLEKRGIT